ncbi:MAG TPA: hypothetical protein VH206_03530 [Xanthobacteraceae bacterium]|jgi:hypothetical protein|nr:hypothetical protein [Xanthobacteraceae bacterium]
MRFSSALFALAITLGLAMSSVAAKAEDSDSTGPKSHPFPKRIYQGGSCENYGYTWPGISLTIFDDHPRKPVRAWICMREFTLAPHDWPWHYP